MDIEVSDDGATQVTIIVVSYNSETLLPGLLKSLPSAVDGDAEIEVVVVDNASADASVEVVTKTSPDATVVALAENLGYAAAINVGVAATRPRDAILILNDDIRLHAGSINRLLESVDRKGVGIAVPRLVDSDGNLLKSMRRAPTIRRVFGEALLGGDRAGRFSALGEVIQDDERYDQVSHPAWASGCAWMITRECWDVVGTWDESFFLYAEDTDYALRAGDAGFLLEFVPTAVATHLVGPSHRDPRLWAMLVWNRYRLFHLRNGPIRSVAFRVGLILNEALRAGVGRSVHRAALAALIFEQRRPIEVR